MTINQAERRWPDLTDREREIVAHLANRQREEVARVHRQYRTMISQVREEWFNKGHDAGAIMGGAVIAPRNPGTMTIERPEGVRQWDSLTCEERAAVVQNWKGLKYEYVDNF